MTIQKIDFHVADGIADAHQYDVKSGAAASIKAGQFVIVDGGNAGYVKLAPDASDTDDTWVGLAATDSTDTATADGTVQVYDDPDLHFEGKAKTPGNLAQAIKLTSVTLDVDSGVQTIDENDTTKGVLVIHDYDNTTDGNVTFSIKSANHLYG